MNRLKKQVITTSSAEETQKIGEELALQGDALLSKAKVSALYGELGSGKTTFVQGLARGLGIKRRIISPTFVIVRSYAIRIRNYELGIKNFYHIDLYRIDDKTEMQVLGIEEIIKDPQNIVAIEWAEKIENLLPENRIDVHFKHVDVDKREIIIDIK